jgi:hypothetical protein
VLELIGGVRIEVGRYGEEEGGMQVWRMDILARYILAVPV